MGIFKKKTKPADGAKLEAVKTADDNKKSEESTPVSADKEKKNGKKNDTEKQMKAILASIPYDAVYEDGMIESLAKQKGAPNRYSLALAIGDPDTSELVASDSTQIKAALAKIFDGFDDDVTFQIMSVSARSDPDSFLEKVRVKKSEKTSGCDAMIDTYNGVIAENASLGHSNSIKSKYLIFSLASNYPEEARERFEGIEKKAKDLFWNLCETPVRRLSPAERLQLIYSVYNAGGNAFGARAGMSSDDVSLDNLRYMHMTTKDLVAPQSVKVTKDNVLLNDKLYAKSFFISSFPLALSPNLISELSSVSSTMVLSSFYEVLPTDRGFEAAKDAVAQDTVIRTRHDKTTIADRKAGKVIQQRELLDHSEDAYFSGLALDTFTDAKAAGTKVFLTTFVITLYSDNLVDLAKDTRMLLLSGSKFAFQIKPLDYAQKEGLQSALPLADCKIDAKRALTTEKLCALNPLDIQDSLRDSGQYCGVNALNDGLILLDRRATLSPCGLITGVRHSGKTYQVKREIFNDLTMYPDDYVFLISFNKEHDKYEGFVKRMGGTIVTEGNFDPFAFPADYGIVDDGSALKAEFLSAVCAASLDFRATRSDVDSLDAEKRLSDEVKKFCEQGIHNLTDATKFLTEHSAEYASMFKALSGDGNLSTNYILGNAVKSSARFVDFEIGDPVSELIVLERIWRTMITLKKRNINAWVYIDSIDGVMQSPECAKYVKHLLQLTSILGNPITLVVQNAALFGQGELKYSLTGLFPYIGYYKLLSQGPVERRLFTDCLSIQGSLVPYITNAGVGKGLLISSSATVPFNDNMKETATDYEAVNALFN